MWRFSVRYSAHVAPETVSAYWQMCTPYTEQHLNGKRRKNKRSLSNQRSCLLAVIVCPTIFVIIIIIIIIIVVVAVVIIVAIVVIVVAVAYTFRASTKFFLSAKVFVS
uniref:Uncharacterized protein n=1 Tax=Glossina brevipalpis TaxID=37001 RepID=A0A1A9WC91_9MUSC